MVTETTEQTTETTDENSTIVGGKQVYFQIPSLKIRMVSETPMWAIPLVPVLVVSPFSNSTSTDGYSVRNPAKEYLSIHGNWNTPRQAGTRNSRSGAAVDQTNFNQNHTFTRDEATVAAREYLNSLVPTKVQEEIGVEIEEIAHQVNISVFEFSNSHARNVSMVLTRDLDSGLYYVQKNGDTAKYLSRAGAYHRKGTTDRFKRNHLFTYEDARSRAVNLLPDLLDDYLAQRGCEYIDLVS
jgi:hypothetical protein